MPTLIPHNTRQTLSLDSRIVMCTARSELGLCVSQLGVSPITNVYSCSCGRVLFSSQLGVDLIFSTMFLRYKAFFGGTEQGLGGFIYVLRARVLLIRPLEGMMPSASCLISRPVARQVQCRPTPEARLRVAVLASDEDLGLVGYFA